jgi:hypothetical protein
MHCTICNLPTGNIVGSTLPQCKCGWQKPNSPVTQRTWVGLTEEEIDGLHEEIKVRLMGTFNTKDIYRVLEAKLKERNA